MWKPRLASLVWPLLPFGAVAVLLAVAWDPGAARVGAASSFQSIETIIVPVDGTGVASVSALQAGVTYRIVASGTFDTGGPGDNLADAEYADFSNPPSSLLDHCSPAFPDIDLGIAINDSVVDSDKAPHWGDFDPTHE
jgi:hypothetical protein